jgi:hypothetical protein
MEAELTKPYHQQAKTTIALLTTTKPIGHSTPWTRTSLYGLDVPIILDGGCVPTLISLKTVKDLDIIKQWLKFILLMVTQLWHWVKSRVYFWISRGKSARINAIVMENCVFDFLLGRHSFHEFNIKTDGSSHKWLIGDQHLELLYDYAQSLDDSDTDLVKL